MSDRPPPLLLHSLSAFSAQVFAALELVSPERIVEVGSESGEFTLRLVDWAKRRGAVLVSVDPEPAAVVRELEGPALEVVAESSPGALEHLEPADVYVIDGDHNYWVVREELRAIFGDRQPGPLAILHDVGWPAARRDLYYAPGALPPDALHEHDYDLGARPREKELGEGGIRGGGAYASALREGGPRNGVLTAVEDHMDERPGLRLMRIPSVFGLGFLFDENAPWAGPLAELLAPWDRAPLLELLEENRLDLYVRVLDLQDETERMRARADRMIADLADQVGRLQAENAALRLGEAERDGAPAG